MFEHPTGARTWQYPEVETLRPRHHTVKLHMCRYGLRLPNIERFIRKSTRLLVSHESMKIMRDHQGNHQCHDIVAGGEPGVPSISEFAGACPVKFVQAVLNTVELLGQKSAGRFTSPVECSRVSHLEVTDDNVPERCWPEVLAVGRCEAKPDSDLMSSSQSWSESFVMVKLAIRP